MVSAAGSAGAPPALDSGKPVRPSEEFLIFGAPQKNWERRQEIWATYQREFAGLPLTIPAQPDGGTRLRTISILC
jgi:hypothetical protein